MIDVKLELLFYNKYRGYVTFGGGGICVTGACLTIGEGADTTGATEVLRYFSH